MANDNYMDAIELRCLVEKLRARYPGIHIRSARYCTYGVDGERQQEIQYQAPLASLEAAGLVVPEMLRPKRNGRTSLGEGFTLFPSWPPGCWDLYVYTAMSPRESPRIAVTEAKRLLKKIAAQAETAR